MHPYSCSFLCLPPFSPAPCLSLFSCLISWFSLFPLLLYPWFCLFFSEALTNHFFFFLFFVPPPTQQSLRLLSFSGSVFSFVNPHQAFRPFCFVFLSFLLAISLFFFSLSSLFLYLGSLFFFFFLNFSLSPTSFVFLQISQTSFFYSLS